MKHRGRVLADATSTAWVEVEGIGGCQRCAKGRGCGAGVFGQSAQSIRIECKTSAQLRQDQQVVIEVDDSGSSWLWLVAAAYGLPTLGLIAATLIATLFLSSGPWSVGDVPSTAQSWREALIVLAALAGLAGGVFAWRYLSPMLIARLEKGLCLQSARIVAVDNSFAGET